MASAPVMPPFEVGALPRIAFGAGGLARVPELAASFGTRVLLVTGERSFRDSRFWPELRAAFESRRLSLETLAVAGEPSPALVDDAVARFRVADLEVVVGIGGGSALDAAKAIAGLLPTGAPVMDHLEQVGRGVPYRGPALPLVALPTTAGTGSEATRNAVLSVRGPDGFKRSFRHDALMPRWAVLDPDLLESCPRSLIVADGMDALTQLLESYVSRRASPFTDALAESGLAAVREGLLPWAEGKGEVRAARGRIAWAALASGIALAHAGLGSVHGLASPLGAWFPVPHGVACGTLLAEATNTNVRAMRARAPAHPALRKYARAHALLSGAADPQDGRGAEALVALLRAWTRRLDLPRLRAYGVGEGDLSRIAAASGGGSMRTNPIELSDAEVAEIARRRL